MNESKTQTVARLASEIIADCAPGVPRTSDVAEKIAAELGVGEGSVRRWLRQAVEEKLLVELHPDMSWRVRIGEERLYLTRVYPKGQARLAAPYRFELTPEGVYSGYRPGRKTFLTTPERAAQAVADKKAQIAQAQAKAEAEEDAKRAAIRAGWRAEREEIDRRDPSLLPLLIRLKDAMGGDRMDQVRPMLSAPVLSQEENIPLADQELSLQIGVCTPQGVDVLKRVLEAGLAALDQAQKEQSA